MQFKFYSFPDPHYFVMILPLACVALSLFEFRLSKLQTITFSTVAFIALTPTFYLLPYANYPAKKMGQFIQSASIDGPYILDFPVAIYFADLRSDVYYSSDEMLEYDLMNNDRDKAYKFIEEKNIQFIASQDVSFTNTLKVWPEMREGKRFEFKNITIEPIYRFDPLLEKPKSKLERLFVYPIYKNRGTCIIWELVRK